MMAAHPRLGERSPVRTAFFESPRYDSNLSDLVFQFAGFTEPSKQEKAKQVSELLKSSLFKNNDNEFSSSVSEFTEEDVLKEILVYSRLV